VNDKKRKFKITLTLNPTPPTPRSEEAERKFGAVVYQMVREIKLPERKREAK
jgi:hypothetical protein